MASGEPHTVAGTSLLKFVCLTGAPAASEPPAGARYSGHPSRPRAGGKGVQETPAAALQGGPSP